MVGVREWVGVSESYVNGQNHDMPEREEGREGGRERETFQETGMRTSKGAREEVKQTEDRPNHASVSLGHAEGAGEVRHDIAVDDELKCCEERKLVSVLINNRHALSTHAMRFCPSLGACRLCSAHTSTPKENM